MIGSMKGEKGERRDYELFAWYKFEVMKIETESMRCGTNTTGDTDGTWTFWTGGFSELRIIPEESK